ncbi:response regulator transcription factor [Cohnella suwonensis]|uniref:Response regulator transcription factor n=1 Tax=Cohnella suwonensis TaxID=696072 RepID=A0ABW0LRU0_9BACL
MYKIAYIDDQDGQIRKVQRTVSADEIEASEIDLSTNPEEVIQQIIESDFDAVLIDYKLNETRADIHYSGADLARLLGQTLYNFPYFLLTSHSNDAEEEAEDVHRVYDRAEFYQNPQKLNRRIKMSIDHYRREIEKSETRLEELKAKESLSLLEEEELISLDDFLEKSISQGGKIPKELKKTSHIDKMNELLSAAQMILGEVKRQNDK